MRDKREACKILVEKPEGRKHFAGIGIYNRIILKWILNE